MKLVNVKIWVETWSAALSTVLDTVLVVDQKSVSFFFVNTFSWITNPIYVIVFSFFVSVGDIATPTRSRKQLDLPVSVLMQPRCQDSTEVDSKMKEIMKMNGILNIKGKVNNESLPWKKISENFRLTAILF